MGAKQQTLARLLSSVGEITNGAVPYPTRKQVASSNLATEVDRVYRSLGGILQDFPVNFRAWDIEFNGIAVELDEQLHFNQYRAVTLESALYAQLPAFPLRAYQAYCNDFEDECLRAGKSPIGKWTNPSCEKQFGSSGAPRWKQRAFYDFVKDLTPMLIGVSVARIAIWDSNVKKVLECGDSACTQALAEIIFKQIRY